MKKEDGIYSEADPRHVEKLLREAGLILQIGYYAWCERGISDDEHGMV